MVGVIGRGLVTAHAGFENRENGEMSYSEKTQEITEWMYTEDFIKHITTVENNVFKAGGREQVQLLLIKIGELSNVIMDKDTGDVNIQALKVALFRGLLAIYKAHLDFEESGR